MHMQTYIQGILSNDIQLEVCYTNLSHAKNNVSSQGILFCCLRLGGLDWRAISVENKYGILSTYLYPCTTVFDYFEFFKSGNHKQWNWLSSQYACVNLFMQKWSNYICLDRQAERLCVECTIWVTSFLSVRLLKYWSLASCPYVRIVDVEIVT